VLIGAVAGRHRNAAPQVLIGFPEDHLLKPGLRLDVHCFLVLMVKTAITEKTVK
jgi:hypothetical protein